MLHVMAAGKRPVGPQQQAVAKRLIELRKALGWTQDKLASEAGLVRTQIVQAEGSPGTTARTPLWHNGIGRAVGVKPEVAGHYLAGEITLTQLLAARGAFSQEVLPKREIIRQAAIAEGINEHTIVTWFERHAAATGATISIEDALRDMKAMMRIEPEAAASTAALDDAEAALAAKRPKKK